MNSKDIVLGQIGCLEVELEKHKEEENITFKKVYIEFIIEQLKELKQDLDRLEQIDKAEPSDALDCLIGLEEEITEIYGFMPYFLKIKFDIIRQALLKAQKQDVVLEAIKDLLNDGVLWLEIEHEMVESELHKEKKQLIKEWLDNGKSL